MIFILVPPVFLERTVFFHDHSMMLLMILYLSSVPSPVVTVSPIQSMLLAGSSLSHLLHTV